MLAERKRDEQLIIKTISKKKKRREITFVNYRDEMCNTARLKIDQKQTKLYFQRGKKSSSWKMVSI